MKWHLRPARDIDLTFSGRLRAHARERGLIGAVSNTLWRGAIGAFLAAAHGLHVSGREHIPPDGPFVMIANHTSHLDALALAAALPGHLARKAVALAAGDTFFGTVPQAMFAVTALNALPVWRGDTSAGDLAFLRRRLMEDRMIFILFPEGTRSRDGTMGRFRSGLGAFVSGTAVPVLPCFIHGAHACWPPNRRLPRPGPLHLAFGAPLRFDALTDDREGWKRAALTAEHAVARLGA